MQASRRRRAGVLLLQGGVIQSSLRLPLSYSLHKRNACQFHRMQSISACLSSGFGKLCKSNIILLTIFRDYLSKCWLATSILAVATNFGTYETSIDLNAPCHEVGISAQWRDTIVANWFTLWGGDYSYLNKTVTPDFQLYQDRIPTGNGSVPVVVNNSSSFLAFVKDSRAGFEKYGFRDDLHFGEDNLVTVRWTLDAVFAGSKTA